MVKVTKRFNGMTKAQMDLFVDKYVQSMKDKPWKDVPVDIWEEHLKALTPVDSSLGTHCCDSTYEYNGNIYRVTFEYSSDEPLGVEVKVDLLGC